MARESIAIFLIDILIPKFLYGTPCSSKIIIRVDDHNPKGMPQTKYRNINKMKVFLSFDDIFVINNNLINYGIRIIGNNLLI